MCWCCTVSCATVTLKLKAAHSEQSLHYYSAFLHGRFDPFWRYVIWHVFHGLLTTVGKAFLWRQQLAVFDRCSGGSWFEQVLFWFVAYVRAVDAPTFVRHFAYSEISLGVTYVKKRETWGFGGGGRVIDARTDDEVTESDRHLHSLRPVTTVQCVCFVMKCLPMITYASEIWLIKESMKRKILIT
jgi:hypothetical protein